MAFQENRDFEIISLINSSFINIKFRVHFHVYVHALFCVWVILQCNDSAQYLDTVKYFKTHFKQQLNLIYVIAPNGLK